MENIVWWTQWEEQDTIYVLEKVFICKEGLGTLFVIGCGGMRILVQHADTDHNTVPIHRLSGRGPEVWNKFQENVVPPLAYNFKNQILPMGKVQDLLDTHVVQCHKL